MLITLLAEGESHDLVIVRDLVWHLLSNGVVVVSEEVGDGDGGRVGLGELRGWLGGLTVPPTVEEEYVWGGGRGGRKKLYLYISMHVNIRNWIQFCLYLKGVNLHWL